MQWDDIIESYLKYLAEERGMVVSSVLAYELDIKKFSRYCIERDLSFRDIKAKDIKGFMEYLETGSMSIRTESKILSGVSSFMKFLLREGIINNDPMGLIDYPRPERKELVILSVEEIDSLLNAVDLNNALGYRNRAIIETLYSCGLKVSELVNLKFSNLHFREGFIEIEGSYQRLVPVCDSVKEQINLYLKKVRKSMKIKPGFEEFLFLNNRGEKMSRVMVFTIVKNLGKEINLKEKVNAQTLRDSFAVHLLQRGAPVEVVQKLLGHRSAQTTELYVEVVRELRGV
jgi:integrase/recombinase XerD